MLSTSQKLLAEVFGQLEKYEAKVKRVNNVRWKKFAQKLLREHR